MSRLTKNQHFRLEDMESILYYKRIIKPLSHDKINECKASLSACMGFS